MKITDLLSDIKPQQPMVVVAIFFISLLLGFHHLFDSPLPERGDFAITIDSPTRAVIEGCRGEDKMWHECFERVAYGADSTLNFEPGDRLTVYAHLPSQRRYIYITERSITDLRPSTTPHRPSAANRWAAKRLQRIGLNDNSLSIIEALLLGNRERLSRDTLQSYRRSGMSHLLAVSGLHVGIIALIIGLLLLPLTLLFRGVELRMVIVIGAVWCYAAVVGMSASVERAVLMVSALLLSRLLWRSYSSLNVLGFVGVVMLIADRSLLFDVGFTLSFIAVLAILIWVLPLWNRRGAALRSWWADWLILPLLIGVACSVATLPLTSHIFGYIAIKGVILNPMLILTVTMLLTIAMLWLAIGWITPLTPLFATVIDNIVELHNSAIEWAADGALSGIECQLSLGSMLLLYGVYLSATYLIRRG